MATERVEVLALLEEFEAAVERVSRTYDQNDITIISDLLAESQSILREVVIIEDLLPDEMGKVIIDSVQCIVRSLQDNLRCTHSRGRPPVQISKDYLIVLFNAHFSISEVARILGVSSKTVKRRIESYGLEEKITFSDIDDTALDEITKQYTRTHPNCGERSFSGFLRSVGLCVQRARVRDSLMRIDPAGVQRRFRQVLHRRRYNVCMPNSLWHIDGNHKLIKWRIVIHGGIDGYSRLPVYLHAANNNKSATVLECFLNAVQQYGLQE